MEVFDSEGNVVEGVMTAEEVTAKIEAEKAAWEATQKPADPAPAGDEPPAWAKELINKVQTLSGNQQSMVVGDITGGLDADKREAFTKRFDSLQGYEDTPEGIQRRAQDAYLLTVGQPYQSQAINMGNIVASGNGPVRPAAPALEVDKAFGAAFGITEQDVAKYGNK